MKKSVFRFLSVFTVLVLFVVMRSGGQDFDHYQTLRSSGQVPEKFLVSSTVKYENDIKTLSKKEKHRLRRIKKQFYLENSFAIKNLLLSGRIVFNDSVGNYVNRVMDEILKNDKELRSKIEIYIIRSNSVNAFTLQNGIICVYVGLLAQLHNEAELAFILCHELTHFTEQHIMNSIVEDANINSGHGTYRKTSYDEKLLAASKFSKKNETEADLAGLQRLLKTDYDASTLGGVFDIMEYSESPFSETVYKKSFLETDNLTFPPTYLLKKTQAVLPDDDDSLSTHPAANLRRQAVMEKLKGVDEKGKKKFIVGEQEFYSVRKICRYEISDNYLHYRDYEAAFYNTFLLMQDNPNSFYLKKCIAKSLYGLSKYANSDRFNEVNDDYHDIEGTAQQVYFFFNTITPGELNTLAVAYLYNLKKQFPADKEIAAMTQDIFDELPKYHPDISFFSTQPKPASLDSLLASELPDSSDNDTLNNKIPQSKYDSAYNDKKIENEKQGKNYFIKYAFVDLLKDPEFVSDYKKAIDDYENVQKEDAYEETKEYKRAKRKQERRDKRIGIALGLNKLVIVNPFYYKVDISKESNPVKLVASETAQKELNNSIKTNASLAGLNYELIDMKDLNAHSADLFNDLSVLKNYFSEEEAQGDMHFVNYMTDDIQALTKKYGTDYFDWTGVICSREHSDNQKASLKTMFLCFSILYFPLTPYTIYNEFRIHYSTYIESVHKVQVIVDKFFAAVLIVHDNYL